MDRQHNDPLDRNQNNCSQTTSDTNHSSLQESQKQIMEIKCQQEDLEKQNIVLQKDGQDILDCLALFAKFYEDTTVAYLALNKKGEIVNANSAAADLLGFPLSMIVNNGLDSFIYQGDIKEYLNFIQKKDLSNNQGGITVRLKRRKALQTPMQCAGLRIINCVQESCIQNEWLVHLECRLAMNYQTNNQNFTFLMLTDCSESSLEQESSRCLNGKLEDQLNNQADELIGTNLILRQKIEELSLSRHQLVEKEAMLNAIFNTAVEGIFTIDKTGIICSVNTAVQTIFGYCPDELVGRSVNLLIPASNRKKHDTYLQLKDTSKLDRVRNVDGLRKDGTLVPLDISITEFCLDNANYYASVVRDVSSRKREGAGRQRALK
jgi:PAS domain S-box-containing protein